MTNPNHIDDKFIEHCRKEHRRRLNEAKPDPIESAIPTENITTLHKVYLPVKREIPKKTIQSEFKV